MNNGKERSEHILLNKFYFSEEIQRKCEKGIQNSLIGNDCLSSYDRVSECSTLHSGQVIISFHTYCSIICRSIIHQSI